MSDRPKWMPSRESLLPMCHNESLYDSCEYDYAGEEVEDSHYRTGLRAQIAVLDEVLFQSNPAQTVTSIMQKIAALRKELGE